MVSALAEVSAKQVVAHALAVETEATHRFMDFADSLEARGEEAAAGLLRGLAQADEAHAEALARLGSCSPEELPLQDHDWLDERPVEAHAHAFMYHLMTPYDALAIALRAECRARDYFAHARETASGADAHRLADEMVREKETHIRILREALDKAPRPMVRDEDFEQLLGYSR